jgi:nitrogen fixation protein NifX
MSSSPLANEIALRIALAAREIPDTDAARLLAVLDDAIGLPPTEKKLSGLTLKTLKSALDNEFADTDSTALKSALSYLRGEAELIQESLPEVVAYQDGDMPNSIRVACASNTGENLDGHFGSCQRFLIYQVSEQESRLIEIRGVKELSEDQLQFADDKNALRTSMIKDCQIVFVVSVGGPAAAKIVRAGIHPIKKPEAGLAIDEISSLQQVIGSDAPPWLAKVMGQSPEQRIRFTQENTEQETAEQEI